MPENFETVIVAVTEQDRARAHMLIDVYETLANDPTVENIRKNVRDDYVQHSPLLPDGPQGLTLFFASAKAQYGVSIDVHKVIVVGDWAVAHVNFRNLTSPNVDDLGMAAVDIYTFGPDGKLAEHWDTVQGVPTHSVNPHGMFLHVRKGAEQ